MLKKIFSCVQYEISCSKFCRYYSYLCYNVWTLIGNDKDEIRRMMMNKKTMKRKAKRCNNKTLQPLHRLIPDSNHMSKVNNRNTRTRCEIWPKLAIKIPERHQWRSSCIFIVNFGHISHLVLVFLLLTLKQVNAGWNRFQV